MVQLRKDIDYKTLYEDLQVKYAAVIHELDQLKKMIFGSRHERFIAGNGNPSQLNLDIQAEAAAQCSIIDAKKISYTTTTTEITEVKKDHPGRMKLPEHLERRETIIEPVDKNEGCKKIGEEITEELEYEPGKLFVNRFVRPKYATSGNETVIIAPMIQRPLPKAIAGPGVAFSDSD